MRKRTNEEFISESKRIFGDTYTYHETDYRGSFIPVFITCRVHGKWSSLPSNHLSGRGCPKCGTIATTSKTRKSDLRIREQIRLLHGDRYEYKDDLGYENKYSKLDVRCNDHGWFTQIAHNHIVMGHGCPMCAVSGYKSNSCGTFYILYDEGIIKIGITNKGPTDRCKAVNFSSKRRFSVLKEYFFYDGRIPNSIETQLLRELRKKYRQPSEQFEGSTECFYDVNLIELLNRIEVLIKEHEDAPQAAQQL